MIFNPISNKAINLKPVSVIAAILKGSGLAIAALGVLANPSVVQAQYRMPPPPPDAPESGRGGGDRSFCPALAADVNITAITPSPEGWGTTITSLPTVWLDVTYDSNQVESFPPAVLYILDRTTGDVIDLTEAVTLPDSPGLFSLTLPMLPTGNKWYEWYLELDCSPPNDPDNFSYLEIGGLIYFDATLAPVETVESMVPADQVLFYEEKGVWYDLFNQVASLQCAAESETAGLVGHSLEENSPEMLQSKLSELLEGAGLSSVQSTELNCTQTVSVGD